MTSETIASGNEPSRFHGFESLEANFVFCPNQLFDLVIPNYSRPVVRLVCYILHQTLRWLDEDGHPVKQDIAISFNDLVQYAGIARGSIRKAIAEAVNAKLIQCVVKGHSKRQGQPGRVGEYSLYWDETGHFAKAIESFKGFYLGQGNRSPIPHSFFTHVVPNEPLAVAKVVATVLRHTVGYQNQYGGGRKSEAQLPFKMIHRYARIASPDTVATSIRIAIASNYIRLVRSGRFSSDAEQQCSAVYAVNWLTAGKSVGSGSKTEVGDRFKNRSNTSVQKSKLKAFNKQSRNGSESVATDGFKNRTTINNSSKEQQTTVAAVDLKSVGILTRAGFDSNTAKTLARKSSANQIEDQISWMRFRTASTNRLGLLRKAIEEKWPEPTGSIQKRRAHENWERERQRHQRELVRERELESSRDQWIKRWSDSPIELRTQCKLKAISAETNPTVRRRLEQKSIDDSPPANFLLVFKNQQVLETPTESFVRQPSLH